jgi:uncharacterized membrane protein (Fun14 family)
MFGSLLDSVRSLSTVNYDPHAIATTAIALNRYHQSGAILIQDSALEERLLPALEANEAIEAVALFGFRDQLRMVFHMSLKGIPVEALLVIQPTNVTWENEQHTMTFSYELERIEPLTQTTKITIAALKTLIKKTLPFGGIIGAIAGYVAGKATNKLGLATISTMDGLTEKGIQFEEGLITVNLEAQSELAPLWKKLDTEQLTGGSIVAALLKWSGTPDSVAAMFTATGLKADREGLHLQLELTPQAKAIFEGTAALYQSGAKKEE